MMLPPPRPTLFPYTTLFRSFAQAHEGLRGAVIELLYPSVGATENTILAAVRAKGATLIKNAAIEPEIIDLILFLQKRSEEHTSELQSLRHLVCRLLLEKKKD